MKKGGKPQAAPQVPGQHKSNFHHERDTKLSHDDAESGAPENASVCGEEDPGAALEDLVRKEED